MSDQLWRKDKTITPKLFFNIYNLLIIRYVIYTVTFSPLQRKRWGDYIVIARQLHRNPGTITS